MALAWYSTGTIAVPNNGNTVTGTSTVWLANSDIGQGILLPDGRTYEITNIASDLSLTIKPNYIGSTVAGGGAYQIVPIQGYLRSTAAQIAALITAFSAYTTLAAGAANNTVLTFQAFAPVVNSLLRANSSGVGVNIGAAAPGTLFEVIGPNQTLTTGANGDAMAHIAAMTSDAAGIDIGAAIGMGGNYNAVPNKQLFGAISGRKLNGTAGSASGYLGFWANDNTSLKQYMRLNQTGLFMDYNTNANALLTILNDSVLGSALAGAEFRGHTAGYCGIGQTGSGYTTSGLYGPNTGTVYCSNDMVIIAGNSGTGIIRFAVNGGATASMIIDGSGKVLVGTTTSTSIHTFVTSTGGTFAFDVENRHASNPFGLQVWHTAVDTNDSGHNFIYCVGLSALRASIQSNGGLANFSANNVNLSDSSVKPEQESLDVIMPKLWYAHKAIDWMRFKYHDQTHDDWNYGYTAQGIRKAFAGVAPELVDQWNGGKLLSVYHHDVTNISGAVLAEAQRRIESLEKEVARLAAR